MYFYHLLMSLADVQIARFSATDKQHLHYQHRMLLLSIFPFSVCWASTPSCMMTIKVVFSSL